MARLWRLIAAVTAAAVATAIGLGIFAIINAAPALVGRAEYLMVTWLVTLPLGIVLGMLGLVKSMDRFDEWLNSRAGLAQGKPDRKRVMVVCAVWLFVAISAFVFTSSRAAAAAAGAS